MDAHLFRRAVQELEKRVGCRITKIYQYDMSTFVFSLYGNEKKNFLVVNCGRNPLMFFSDTHEQIGTEPTAKTMLLRKYLMGKRIVNLVSEWWERKMYFQVAPTEVEPAYWLCVDLKKNVEILENLPDIQEINWLEIEKKEELISLLSDNSWQNYQIFTPALRKTLIALLEESSFDDDAFLECKSLLLDLQTGEGDVFLYGDEEKGYELSPWPLPESLRKNRQEEVFENILFALGDFGKKTLLQNMAQTGKKIVAKPYLTEIKRLKNLEKKLDLEEERLKILIEMKDKALQIQRNLYQFNKHEKYPSIDIEGIELVLNNKLSLVENMEFFFHQSARGKRGLEYLIKRREEVSRNIIEAKLNLQGALALNSNTTKILIQSKKAQLEASMPLKGKKSKKEFPKQVLVRESADGFTILLGKDVKGNSQVLKLASSTDYWLHTADGASAHAIIRRDHGGVMVPQSTFDEAGKMVAEKSPFKNDEKVLIQYALAKHIQPMRNAGKGMVRIAKSEGSFIVSMV